MVEIGQAISPQWILVLIIVYFLMLVGISYWTTRGENTNESFFLAGRNAPWYLIAIGMIGTSISGVTFISVPGFVEANQFSYFQVVIGYIFGYLIIGLVLMPMYYRLNLTSIYGYLEKRFGWNTYKTGSAFFLLSRSIGSACRLYLVALVLYQFVFGPMGMPFWLATLITIFLIWVYTFKGGIKTIVYTDTFQTFFLLSSLVISIYLISKQMGWGASELFSQVKASKYSKTFFFDSGWSDNKHFIKQFLGGMFITIVMTGLDQDLMQKNLACRNIKDAQKNMFWFTGTLVLANALFLMLGALLYLYAANKGIAVPAIEVAGIMKPQPDLLFPTLAINHFGGLIGVFFILGLVAANYASADSALAALTTAFCVDFLGFERNKVPQEKIIKTRTWVHFGFSMLLFFMVWILWYLNDRSVIDTVLTLAGYTYGPLLGLFAFGFFVKRQVKDRLVPIICILSPVITFILNKYSTELFWGYKFSFELLLLNGLLTFFGLMAISYKSTISSQLLGFKQK
ncbi:MAG: sodium:solute symporter [Saprospiraceae bacterium]|jgi:SSS family transporter|nr:sodium:solute symporter [Saprospiraceae bacterium]MBK6480430.1 sodium:solute symporter [Saprospiraceae bacterium]MBK6817198.1 sodium:solute symporter [Saprospiraceae bacterium]MBK7435774.1 sodium:solute symporter [Saprospiraceae bacterium]MBK7606430.1 sodium:solute symporter [Saprospiraceae bacterium]